MILKNIGVFLTGAMALLLLLIDFQIIAHHHHRVFQHFRALDAAKAPLVIEAYGVERFLIGSVLVTILLAAYFGCCSYTLFLSAKADARKLSQKQE